jgi:hypothetical protein
LNRYERVTNRWILVLPVSDASSLHLLLNITQQVSLLKQENDVQIKPSSPLSNYFQQYIGQFSRHRDHGIMARWQLSQPPPRLRWRKRSARH